MWLWAPAVAAAGDWTFDYEAGEWRIASLEQPRDGFLEQDKLAIGCSMPDRLFVKRYAPAGSRPASAMSFEGGVTVLVVWDNIGVPNTMWLFDERARTLIEALVRTQSVAIREIGALAQPSVTFALDGAVAAVEPIVTSCGAAAVAQGGAGAPEKLELTTAE